MSRCHSPRVKGNGITMAPRLRVRLFLLLSLVLAACGTQASPSPSVSAERSAPASMGPSAEPATSYPVTLTDDAGREVVIEAEPQRIVSVAPSNTEIVCALELCELIVGVNDFRDGFPDDVLEAIERVPDVASFTGVDREAVVELEADLVLAAGNELTPSADIDALAELGLPVLVLYPESLDEV